MLGSLEYRNTRPVDHLRSIPVTKVPDRGQRRFRETGGTTSEQAVGMLMLLHSDHNAEPQRILHSRRRFRQ
ncbi:hypothetical protein AB0H71_32595 [Nocardia sp. NPDC050697]|uniref:hypothetical protein n=1 Tax=Nocardia sp. NPDC050697 TaxID=3155158 RepID=UPI0033C8E572